MMEKTEFIKDFLDTHGIRFRDDALGSECTTFRTGGRIALFCEPDTVEKASELLSFIHENDVDSFLIGNGSNLLIGDSGSDKLFVRLAGELAEYNMEGDTLICGGGASFAAAAKHSVSQGYMGLEWASGIPGTVGGAIAMNASAYGGETKTFLKKLLISNNGKTEEIVPDPEKMGYRVSAYAFPKAAVLRAEFKLIPDDGTAKDNMERYSQKRKASQPLNYPSAGSTLKRPAGHFAGALIEQAGLKGLRVGGASVSEKHAGFIINDNGATSDEILELIGLVQKKVYDRFGVMLEPEVIIL